MESDRVSITVDFADPKRHCHFPFSVALFRSGVPLDGAPPDQVINSDRVAVLNRVENIIHARRQNEWINAKENVPANRNYSKRSSVASSARLNVRNGRAKAAKTQTSREWFRDRNSVKLSTCPEFSPDPSAPSVE
jgi:hypothetical protein